MTYPSCQDSNKKKGFTLIELIVVIAILAIIAALAVPAYNGLQEQSRLRVAAANMDTLERAYAVAKELAALDGAVRTRDEILVASAAVSRDPYDVAVGAAMRGLMDGAGMEYHIAEEVSAGILEITYGQDGWEYNRGADGEITASKKA